MATKPIKFLELHYTMTQFLIKADTPRGMLIEHEKNLRSTNIPSGLSAYKPQKLVVYCFYIIIQRTRDFSVGLPAP